MWILREEILRADFAIGEVAAPAAGDANALAQLLRVLDQQHFSPALAGLRGAHHAGRAGANDDDVKEHGEWGLWSMGGLFEQTRVFSLEMNRMRPPCR